MKFSNGQWLTRKGITIINPFEVRDMEIDAGSITCYAPCRHIDSRGATLDSSLFTVRFSSPLEDVICVQIWHFMGKCDKGPGFSINRRDDVKVDIADHKDWVGLTSGNLSVRIQKEKWAVEFKNGDSRITGSGFRCAGYITTDAGEVYMREQLDLGVGEYVYGLGERFTPFVKNGQVVDIWNEDGGTSSEQAYKNVPFYLSNKGYGVFVNYPGRVSYEIASERVSKVQFSVPGEYLEYYIINGPDPKKVIENYTALTGRPALPPAWSFGLWLSTSFTTQYDEETVSGFLDGMSSRDLPLSVFHFDCFWMKEYHWCDFRWDERVFPDPEGMLARLKKRGLKICVWINPYIAQRSPLFSEGKEKGYLLKKANGDVWQWDRWQAGMGIVDFTNPEACRWYAGYLKRLLDMGVDCFKTDFGERIPVDVVYFDGSDPVKMHNYYTYLYNKVVFELLEEKFGKGGAVVFARSATAGSQKFPLHWGGDCWADFDSMAESLRGGLSLGISGFGYWSHDIGGFEQKASADVYKRWVAFGLLSSHSRLHGSTSYRVPWLFDDEAVDVLRFFTKLKYSLMPYLFGAAVEARDKGVPMLRAMLLEFPGEPVCDFLDRQYMLGDSLLVAPIFSEDGTVSYYLPQGCWTNFFTGEKIAGGTFHQEKHGYLSIPLMVRPNSILPVGAIDNSPEYDYADKVTFHLFEIADGCDKKTVVYNPDGNPALQIIVRRNGNNISIEETQGGGKAWYVLLRGISEVNSIKGGTGAQEQKGFLITPAQGAKKLELELKP